MRQAWEAPAIPRVTVQPTGGLGLFGDSDNTEPLAYRVEKMRAVRFWAKGESLPQHAMGICVVCGTYLHREQVPATHHAIFRRSAGSVIHDWINLLPMCSQHCHDKIEAHAKHKEVMIRYYLRLSQYHLLDDFPTPARGRQFLLDWIAELHKTGRLDERQPYLLPEIQGDENGSE